MQLQVFNIDIWCKDSKNMFITHHLLHIINIIKCLSEFFLSAHQNISAIIKRTKNTLSQTFTLNNVRNCVNSLFVLYKSCIFAAD